MSSMSQPYTVLPTRKSSVRRSPVRGATGDSKVEAVEAKVLQRIVGASECVVGKTSLCSGGQRSAGILRQRGANVGLPPAHPVAGLQPGGVAEGSPRGELHAPAPPAP